MDQCKTCHRELEPGFAFCHYCGAQAQEVHQPVEAVDWSRTLTELQDIGKKIDESIRVTQKHLDQLLGSPTSPQRQILYTLMTSATLNLYSTRHLSVTTLWPFIQECLLDSVLLLIPISYWLTGIVPFSRQFNFLAGDELSLRRRIFLALLLAFWFPILTQRDLRGNLSPLSIAQPGFLESFSHSIILTAAFIGSFLTMYYLMGYAANWRPIPNLEHSIYINGMATAATNISTSLLDQIRSRDIRGLQTNETEMAKLRRYTAGQTSATRGHQIDLIRGKVRVSLFTQDVGKDLFIRWRAYYDASGRRLWIIIGFFIFALDSFTARLFATGFVDFSHRFASAISPASRNQVIVSSHQSRPIAKMFGLIQGLSEYTWNEIYALEGAVRRTVQEVTQSFTDEHQEIEQIKSQLEQQVNAEAKTVRMI